MSLAVNSGPHEDRESSVSADFSSFEQFRLEIVEGPGAGQVVVSASPELVIGSDRSADLVVAGEAVSPFHCRIESEAGRFTIQDLDSGSGTFVNDIQVETAHLLRPALITIGASRIRFERLSAQLHVRRSTQSSFHGLVGSAPAMRSLYAKLEKLAQDSESVLISGERATGKGVVALALHRSGGREDASFRVVDCTLTYDRVERKLVEAFAHGGTLFLREVGHLHPDLQGRLLNVFAAGRSMPAGLRLLSSSSVDLRKEVNAGRFDAELYRRLSHHRVSMPSLCQRVADMRQLVELAMQELEGVDEDARRYFLSSEFLKGLAGHDWPENMRELVEHLERCIDCSRGSMSEATSGIAALPLPDIDIDQPIKPGREEWIKHFERQYIARLLDDQGGNVTRAAKRAGVDRGHFYRLMFRCGLRQS